LAGSSFVTTYENLTLCEICAQQLEQVASLRVAIDDTITEWLHARASKHLTVALAKDLAQESKTGWFITAHREADFVIGKFALAKYTPNHFVRRDDGELLIFHSVEAARMFLADELRVLSPAVFNFR
jgi:hypothetical protein